MSLNIANVQLTNTFDYFRQRVNDCIAGLNIQAVTVNSNVTSGNAVVNGAIQANTVYASNLSGGAIGATANLVVTTNATFNANVVFSGTISANAEIIANAVSIGNSTVNVTANSVEINVTDATYQANLTSSTLGIANIVVNNSISVGNSTVNAVINSSSFNSANVNLTNRLSIGNSTVNSAINSSALNIGPNITVSNTTIYIGNSTVNTTINSSSFNVGANVSINASAYFVGNSTVNTVINSTNVVSINHNISNNLSVGANVSVTTTALSIGNSTVNTVINSVSVTTANLFGTIQTVSQPSITTLATVTFTGNATVNNTFFVGNSTVGITGNSSQWSLGNSTVNSVINSTSLNSANANLSNQLLVGNSSVFTVINSTNTTGINITTTNTFAVGSNVIVNTSVLFIGNSTVSGQVNSSALSGWSWKGATIAINFGGTGNTVAPSNGQLLIGNSGNYYVATLTNTDGFLGITNGPGSITLSNLGVTKWGSNSTNYRSGNVTLTATDISQALGYTPSNSNGNYWIAVGTSDIYYSVGNVAIGFTPVSSSANAELEVRATTNPQVAILNQSNSTSNIANAYVDISVANNGSKTSLRFTRANNTAVGAIDYLHSTDTLNLTVAAAQQISVNTTLVSINNALFANGAVTMNTSLTVGNSTVNTFMNSVFWSVGNTTVNTEISSSNVVTNNVVANNLFGTIQTGAQPNITSINTVTATSITLSPTVVNSSIVMVSVNSFINTSAYFVGNSSLNTMITQANVTTTNVIATNLTGTLLTATQLNVTTMNTVTFNTSVAVGANVLANTSTLSIGNSTVNATINSISLIIGSGIINTSAIAVGANVVANTSAILVGNSTVNTSITSNNIGTISQNGGQIAGVRNRIINGDFQWQQRWEATNTTPSSSPTYTADRWKLSFTQGSKINYVANNTGTLLVSGNTIFTKSGVYTAVGGFTPANTDTFLVSQAIEGVHVRDFMMGNAGAQPFTLQFWVRPSITGTYAVAFRNSTGTATRSYVQTYSATAAQWNYVSMTVPGDTTGTWGNGLQNAGLVVVFDLGSGNSYWTTSGSWQTGNFLSTSACVQMVKTNAATFELTGVQLELGGYATPYERIPAQLQLIQCQRYFEKSMPQGQAPTSATSAGAALMNFTGLTVQRNAMNMTVPFQVNKMVGPTITMYSAGSAATGQARDATAGVDVPASTSDIGHYGFVWGATANTASSTLNLVAQWTAEAEL